MICIKCNKDKENTEFRYRHDRKKYYTICKSCVNLSQRIKRNGCEDVREYIERSKGNADEVKVYSKKYGYAIKPYKAHICEYKLCDCLIREGQVYYRLRSKDKDGVEHKYCSKWCREVDIVDNKLAKRKENEIQHKH